ncbi:DUF4097 family beta strand repeat-containing protein [Actinacidiphila guanduensis]|nr:hypothetical protein [Actinacidiphila guanduensis]
MDSQQVPPKPPFPPDRTGGPGRTDGLDTPPAPARGPRRPVRLAVSAAVLAVAVAVVLGVVLSGNGTAHHAAAAHPAPEFHAGDTGLVVLDGVSGRIRVTADPHAHGVAGRFVRSDGRALPLHAATEADPATGRDALAVRCGDGDGGDVPCAGDLVLTVPQHTGLRLRQTSGETLVSGLHGDVAIDAASVRLTARGLRPDRAEVTVTSGSADLAFAAAPHDVAVRATSASVALRLPAAGAGYAVTENAASADVRVGVPRDPGSAHHVSLTVTSGSLAVLPS